jgi:hypothetical protein
MSLCGAAANDAEDLVSVVPHMLVGTHPSHPRAWAAAARYFFAAGPKL